MILFDMECVLMLVNIGMNIYYQKDILVYRFILRGFSKLYHFNVLYSQEE